MKCAEYAPWVSRYLDEDLEGEDLEVFFDHLSGCAACQKEVAEVERLRGWLQAADALQGIPEMRGDWGLEELLRREASSEAVGSVQPLTSRAGRPASGRRTMSRDRGWIRRYLFPFPIAPRQVVRFALPLLLVAVVATWLYSRQTSDWSDVHDLNALPKSTVSFPQEEADEIDYFVVQHATHQPWERYGDEVSMLQLASVHSR